MVWHGTKDELIVREVTVIHKPRSGIWSRRLSSLECQTAGAVQDAPRIVGRLERAPAFGLRQSSGAFRSPWRDAKRKHRDETAAGHVPSVETSLKWFLPLP